MLLSEEEIIKAKVEFLKRNAVTLYFMANYKGDYSDYTIEENLLSILLSNEPLGRCARYCQLKLTLSEFEPSVFVTTPGDNYALKTIFSAVRYLNSSKINSEDLEEKKETLRKYCKYIDNYALSTNEIKLPEMKRGIDAKIRVKRGV